MNLKHHRTLIFTLSDKVGALDEILSTFKEYNISLNHIESRPNKTNIQEYDFLVEIKDETNSESFDKNFNDIASQLRQKTINFKSLNVAASGSDEDSVPWFPRKLSDLDAFADKVLEMGEDLDADHPGVNDKDYRKRRAEITNIAKTYKSGQPIPRIQYNQKEIDTWKACYKEIKTLAKKHACKEYLHIFPLLEQNCGYSEDHIPQLEDVSKFLKDCTGFKLKPVMGLLSSRDFLNGLAFRVFHSTQYIRHHSKPLYTPEPDCCHELLGHVPLFANPEFADFSQEIGLASLGASDDDILKLATIYWFTVEFGLCKEGEDIKAYGAGVLSSFGEIEYSMTDKPQKLPFDPKKAAVTKYPITEYQPIYYVADSFSDAKQKVREYAMQLKRPFKVRYNPYTESVDILNSKDKCLSYAKTIKNDLDNLVLAMSSI